MNRGKCKPCAFKSHKFLFRGLGVVLVHWGVVLGCLCTPSPTFPSLRQQQTIVKIRNVKNRSSKNLHGMRHSVTANPMLVSPSVWCSLRQLGKYLALVNLSHPPLITCRSCVSGLLNSASRAEYTSHMSWVIGMRKVWRLMIRNSNSGWLKFKLAQNFHKSHAVTPS